MKELKDLELKGNKIGFLWEVCVKIGMIKGFLFLYNTNPYFEMNEDIKKLLNSFEEINKQIIPIITKKYKNLKYRIEEGIINGFLLVLNEIYPELIKNKKYKYKLVKEKKPKILLELLFFGNYLDILLTDIDNSLETNDKVNELINNFKKIYNNYLKKYFSLDLREIYINREKGEYKKTDAFLIFKDIKRNKKYLFIFDMNERSTKKEEYIEYEENDENCFPIKQLSYEIQSLTTFDKINTDFDEFNINNFFKKFKINKNNINLFISTDFKKFIQMFSYLKSISENLINLNELEEAILITVDGIFNKKIKLNKEELNLETIKYLSELYKSNKSKSFSNTTLSKIIDNLKVSNEVKEKLKLLFKKNEMIITEKFEGSFDNKKDFFILNDDKELKLDEEKDIRKKHKKYIEKYIKENNLFLAGNPGIGKTTSTLSVLISDKNPFNLFYLSPRIAVNKDFFNKIKKFYENEEINKYNKDYILIYTDFTLTNRKDKENNIIHYVNFLYSDNLPEEDINKLKEIAKRKNIILESNIDDNDLHSKSLEKIGENIKLKEVYISETKKITPIIEVIKETLTIINEFLKNNLRDRKIDIYNIITLQSIKTNGSINKFKKIIKNSIKRNNKINSYIFLDEIAGDSGGLHIIYEVLKERYLDIEKKQIKFIISDASLTNIELFKKILKKIENNKFLNSCIYLFNDNNNENIKKTNITLNKNKSINFISLEFNSYPAKNIFIESHFYKIFEPKYFFYKNNFEKRDFFKKNKIEKIIKIIENEINDNKTVLVYIQNKMYLDFLKKEILIRNLFKEEDIIILNSDITNKEKEKMLAKIDNEDYKIALITSSSSRGVSYTNVDTIIIDFQNFNLEEGLMEAIQTSFRARGSSNKKENLRDKKLIFTFFSKISKVSNKEISIIQNLELILKYYLIRNSFLTRIGYNNNIIKTVPIGYFYQNSNEQSKIVSLLKYLSKLLSYSDKDISETIKKYFPFEKLDSIVKNYEENEINTFINYIIYDFNFSNFYRYQYVIDKYINKLNFQLNFLFLKDSLSNVKSQIIKKEDIEKLREKIKNLKNTNENKKKETLFLLNEIISFLSKNQNEIKNNIYSNDTYYEIFLLISFFLKENNNNKNKEEIIKFVSEMARDITFTDIIDFNIVSKKINPIILFNRDIFQASVETIKDKKTLLKLFYLFLK